MMARSKTQAGSFAWNETIQKMSTARANTDASPLTDDLDVTLHEPVTKENDMNEARASERADLVELRRLMEAAPMPVGRLRIGVTRTAVVDDDHNYIMHVEGYGIEGDEANRKFIVAACNALPGLIAEVERLTQQRDEYRSCADNLQRQLSERIAELSRASATAQEPVEQLRHIVAFVGLAARNTPFMPVGKVMDDAMRNVPEPAATASRTVSDEELLPLMKEHGDAAVAWAKFEKSDPRTETEKVLKGQAFSRLVRAKRAIVEKYRVVLDCLNAANALRLIPAPSVAEPAKCGMCGDAKKVYVRGTGPYAEGLVPEDAPSKPCPDCTPDSAEPASAASSAKQCVCGKPKHEHIGPWLYCRETHCDRFRAAAELGKTTTGEKR